MLERLEPAVARLHGDRMAAAEEANALLAGLRPAAEHWYLPVVGTRPGRRRSGLGSAVLAPVLARADADGVPAVADAADPDAAPSSPVRGSWWPPRSTCPAADRTCGC